MATDEQLQANRRNAKRSTGPKSPEGKARSRLNSRKHGLTAKTLIIVGEHSDDFDQLRAELMVEHDPQSVLETELVERLAGIHWRLRRVPFFEAAIMEARHHEARKWNMNAYRALAEDFNSHRPSAHAEEAQDEEETEWERSVRFGHALIKDASSSDALGKLRAA
jgi:hypothetical protein